MAIDVSIPTDPKILASAEEAFGELRSVSDLAGVGRPSQAEARGDLATVLAGTNADIGGLVPIGLLRLRRHAARAKALGISAQARAASTEDDVARMVGPYRIELIEDDDITFLVVKSPDDETLPKVIELFLETARLHIAIPFGNPIDRVIQIGVDPTTVHGQTAIDLLKNPETEILLT